ncbi:MAG: DUF192 domain-containing protein [Gemmatimonadetes bacterium]|nr:DUF192 domain-containing protein [Gemmatimonadota bacterium]
MIHSTTPRRGPSRGTRHVRIGMLVALAGLACDRPPASEPAESAAAAPRPRAGQAWVIFPSDTVVAEVAADPAARYRGLRFRQSLPDGTGMVFLFDEPGPREFTMADTYVPLDIAFIGADMTIGEILPMTPLEEGPYRTDVEALMALEVPQGWYAAHGIEVGTPVEIELGS